MLEEQIPEKSKCNVHVSNFMNSLLRTCECKVVELAYVEQGKQRYCSIAALIYIDLCLKTR